MAVGLCDRRAVLAHFARERRRRAAHPAHPARGPARRRSGGARSFIREQLAAANSIYGPLGIELVDVERVPLGAEHADIVSRSDRDALARYVKRGAVHVFIVARLMDVDEPGRERRGVHWHPRPSPRDSYLIVSQISGRYVLAHELGHMFGNPEHSQMPGNLMCYTRAEGVPFLDEAQIRRVRKALAALLKEGRIVALPPRAAEPAKP